MRASRSPAAFLRIVLAAVVALDLLSFYPFLSEARADALAHGVWLNPLWNLLSRTGVKAAIIAVGVAAAIAFARRPGRIWAGVVALGALVLLSTTHARLYGSPWRHLYFSGLCLAGWIAGLAVARRQAGREDESYACVGATAFLGASYLNAGLSKLVYGGSDWAYGFSIQAVIIGQDGLVPGGILGTYRTWLASTPAAAAAFASATLGFELAGPLMLVGRRTRACVALGLIAMHIMILALTHILYWEAMVLLVSFGLSPDPVPVVVSDEGAPTLALGRIFPWLAALLTFLAAIAVAHQAQRYSRSHPAAAAVEPTSVSPRRKHGRFALGQRRGERWFRRVVDDARERLDLGDLRNR